MQNDMLAIQVDEICRMCVEDDVIVLTLRQVSSWLVGWLHVTVHFEFIISCKFVIWFIISCKQFLHTFIYKKIKIYWKWHIFFYTAYWLYEIHIKIWDLFSISGTCPGLLNICQWWRHHPDHVQLVWPSYCSRTRHLDLDILTFPSIFCYFYPL